MVLLVSGGVDSRVLAAAATAGGVPAEMAVHHLFVDYGQPSATAEWQAAQAGDSPTRPVRVTIRPGQSSLGHNHAPWPMRNTLLACLATAHAASVGADHVAFGFVLPRHGAPFPDATPAWLAALAALPGPQPTFLAPFAELNKREVVDIGQRLGADLVSTFSCYSGPHRPCRTCPGCTDRDFVLMSAGVPP